MFWGKFNLFILEYIDRNQEYPQSGYGWLSMCSKEDKEEK